MKRNLQILATLILATITISCNKDNIYVVGDSSKITSIIVVSDDYSAGMPAIQTRDTYSYDSGTFSSAYSSAMATIDIKVNPSNVSIEGVEWRVLRRSVSSKATDSEELFEGTITASRSASANELVTLNIGDDTQEFFVEDGYVYSVVAVYGDGAEVTSDVACISEGDKWEISQVFMGSAVSGSVTSYALSSNSMVVDNPKMYGSINDGSSTILSFEEMGISSEQYSIGYTTDTSTQTLDISVYNTSQWQVSINDRFADYNYNELNGYAKLDFTLYDLLSNSIATSTYKFYTTMDNVELTNTALVGSNYSSLTFSVLNTSLAKNMILERLMYTETAESFVSYYCNTAANAYTIRYYLDDVESTTMSIDYTTNADDIQLTISDRLSVGVYKIKIVLSSKYYSTTVTEVTTLTVQQV